MIKHHKWNRSTGFLVNSLRFLFSYPYNSFLTFRFNDKVLGTAVSEMGQLIAYVLQVCTSCSLIVFAFLSLSFDIHFALRITLLYYNSLSSPQLNWMDERKCVVRTAQVLLNIKSPHNTQTYEWSDAYTRAIASISITAVAATGYFICACRVRLYTCDTGRYTVSDQWLCVLVRCSVVLLSIVSTTQTETDRDGANNMFL